MSRDRILASVKASQPAFSVLPDLSSFGGGSTTSLEKFVSVLRAIGSTVLKADDMPMAIVELQKSFSPGQRVVNAIEGFPVGEYITSSTDGHGLENVYLSIIEGEFGVAENGAIWIPESKMGVRALPFICEQLAIILLCDNVAPTLHEAYEKIGSANHGFGAFIAGPSKTADIEQSLVLGAHGAKRLTVILVGLNGD